MISFSKYYNLSAEDVECIEATTVESADFPYRLTVHLKSGKQHSVSYKDSKSRDTAKLEMVRQVECQKRQESEKVLSMLYTIKYAVERIDRRELRIWRQLRDLLGIRVEEDN
jgi:hypothetical protein